MLAAKDAGERYADDLKTQLADAKARISVLEISLKDATATINHKVCISHYPLLLM